MVFGLVTLSSTAKAIFSSAGAGSPPSAAQTRAGATRGQSARAIVGGSGCRASPTLAMTIFGGSGGFAAAVVVVFARFWSWAHAARATAAVKRTKRMAHLTPGGLDSLAVHFITS